MAEVSAENAIVALAVIDATLVALFFLFKILPWKSPGPWRLIWAFATLTSALVILAELQAVLAGGTAISLAHQGPLFAAILSASGCFILAYLRGPRSVIAAREEQERELASRSEYLSIVAHELRNPLIAIASAARAIARRDGEAGQMGAGIADEARAALTLLDGLTDLASIESGRLVSALRPHDLATVVRETVRSTQGDREVRLRGVESGLMVLGDDRRIGEVVRNLVGNALKYSGPGAPVEVSIGLTAERDRAVVSVRDHGPGLPPAERGKLFQKFTRLSTSGGTRGSGLGLTGSSRYTPPWAV
ncbi:MAG: HAMP domain-containing histidine kinase [Chloroflexi bacterium]|nr:HAMP domain-containing histidine kinase [Chloroflexota bacterium]